MQPFGRRQSVNVELLGFLYLLFLRRVWAPWLWSLWFLWSRGPLYVFGASQTNEFSEFASFIRFMCRSIKENVKHKEKMIKCFSLSTKYD